MKKLALLGTSSLRTFAFAGAALAMAGPAYAQDATGAETAPTQEEDPAAASGDIATVSEPVEATSEGETITVTGSRIRRNEFNSPDPVAIIDTELAERQGQLDTGDVLQSSPIAAGSSQITSAISSNFVTNGGQGASTISLRGLGAERTLVLLNGRRAGPAGTRGAVSSFDLNALPLSIIERFEILKTGASSVYGSDAVAGVVNIITKRDTDGLELDGFSSVPLQGGGENYRLSATFGKVFDRGHFMASVDYFKRNELKRGDRSYLDCPEEYLFKEGTRERADLIDPRTGNYRCNDTLWGHVWLYDYTYNYSADGSSNLIAPNGRPIPRMQFNYEGNLQNFIPPLAPSNDPGHFQAPPGFFPVGYDAASRAVENAFHPFISNSTVSPRIERWTAYAQGSFELSDSIELFAEFLHNRRETEQDSFRQFWNFGYVEDFAGFGFGDPFAPGFSGGALISPTTITDHFGTAQRVDYTRGVFGARGDFGFLNGWSWDAYGQYSRSKGIYETDIIYDDAVDSQDFRTSSCVGTVTAVRGVPCIDISFTDPRFLRGDFNAAERAFLFGRERGKTIYEQLGGELSTTGTLFTLPAGDVSTALGVTIRRDSINDTPGEVTLANNSWGLTGAGITSGHSVTKEAFAELEVPLIHNTPLIQQLTVSAAGRVTNFKATRGDGLSDSDNGNWTYKLGLNWQVTDFLRFRASYGTSFRAPALFELFLADQSSFAQQRNIDPCIRYATNVNASQQLKDNCAAAGIPGNFAGGSTSAQVFTGGGLGVLEPETSTSKTASVILTPRFSFLPDTRVSVAVDYFDIEVNGEISQLGAGNVVAGCYLSDFFPEDPLCSLFTRVPAGSLGQYSISEVRDSYINVNSQRNRGIDVTTNISQDLGRLGRLSLTGSMTWQLEDNIALFEGTRVSTNGEDGEPKYVGDFSLVWTLKDDWSFFYGLDVIGATSDRGDYEAANNGSLCQQGSVFYGNFCVDVTAKPRFYHAFSVTKELKNFDFTIGVNNLFNTKPPRVTTVSGEISTLGNSVFASQYDYIGRRVFVHAKARF
ncbi:MAG TPA: TonB-dependent receptor [Allosphingosinicella sp.]|nr:TonB-dependent receptor [Allosphingosinicella sp.]